MAPSSIARRARAALLMLGLPLASGRADAQLLPDDERYWALAMITLVGTAAADRELREALQGPGPPAIRSTAGAVEPLGRARTALVGLAASYATARLSGQSTWARATMRVAAGYLAADAVTGVLKPAVDRARPRAALGPSAFHASGTGDQHHAFPSGHATHAFALAAGIAEEARRPWVTTVAYGTAALVAWSRVHDDAHWTSDVVAGSIIGTSASLTTIGWLERRERRRRERRRPGDAPRVESERTHARDTPWRVVLGPGTVAATIAF